MEAIINSFLLVAAAEMGDKTQLLAFVLATRFRKPGAVLAGIFVATLLNHLLATLFGSWIAATVPANYIKWILSATFIGFAIWVLIPDKDEGATKNSRHGAFITTLILFFIAEMGDKTQLSTVALAVQYKSMGLVTLGSTMGMMFSDSLAVIFGEKLTQRISMDWVRRAAALLFFLFGIWILLF